MKYAILLVIVLIFNLNYYAQGETCSTAEEVTINGTYTADGPNSGNGCFTCPGDAANADWYSFTPEEDMSVAVSSCIDGIDTHFYVYEGDCNSLTDVAANDDAGCGLGGGFSSYAEFAVTGGTEYFVEWVDHWSGADFNWTIESVVCAIPVGLFLTNLTDQGVDVNWTSSNVGTTYELEYGLNGFTPGEGTIVTGSVTEEDMTVTLLGLTGGMNFEVYITEICNAGSVTTEPLNFTPFEELAPNDICNNAIEIACGDSLAGNTFNATIDYDVPTCSGTDVDANGIWYHFTGVDGMIKASTCGVDNYDTRLYVYSGSCDDLICVGANDDDAGCQDFASSVHFPAQMGNDYWILVHGFEEESGAFPLVLTCDDVCEPVPSNGSCVSAENISPTTSCQYIETSNVCASINLTNPECSPFFETVDTWYSFNSGEYSTLAIDILLEDAANIGVSVYPSCIDDPILCIEEVDELLTFSVVPETDYVIQFWSTFDDAGSFDFCLSSETCDGPTDISSVSEDESSAVISWNTVNTDLFYIIEFGEAGFVQGEGQTMSGTIGTDGPPVTLTGLEPNTAYDFYILENCADGQAIAGPNSFSTQGNEPDNDECENAISIPSCSGLILGTNVNATEDDVIIDCDSVSNTSPGVWYTMEVEEALTYVVSTCNETTFDTQISIFGGSCGNYDCIASNDDADGCSDGSSEVIFSGYTGLVYIFINGANDEFGNFQLTTSCFNSIEEINSLVDFNLFPNPNNGEFQMTISDDLNKNGASITMYNLQGQVVFSELVQNTASQNVLSFDLSHLSSGVYNVRVSNDDYGVSKRVIIR